MQNSGRGMGRVPNPPPQFNKIKGKVMLMKSKWLGYAISLSLAAVALAAAPGYQVKTTYKLGGEGGWDYLDRKSVV